MSRKFLLGRKRLHIAAVPLCTGKQRLVCFLYLSCERTAVIQQPTGHHGQKQRRCLIDFSIRDLVICRMMNTFHIIYEYLDSGNHFIEISQIRGAIIMFSLMPFSLSEDIFCDLDSRLIQLRHRTVRQIAKLCADHSLSAERICSCGHSTVKLL